MKLVVDGVFYQFASNGIARVWTSILPRLAKYPDLEISLLDRGNCPSINGVEKVQFPSFPSYRMNANTAADSIMIEEYCSEIGADVFSSTYYTTPVNTPSVMIVYDMIPEVLGFDLTGRPWQEKQIAISFASYYACISQNTLADLGRLYPATLNRSMVTYCGVERDIFRPRDSSRVDEFKHQHGISKPYFVLVGSRERDQGYKNGNHIFDAARLMGDLEFEILCAGGEKIIDPNALAGLPSNVTARRIDLTDDDLTCAYSGAEGLVFPSLYEGFGIPVIEAMACGCPVITTKHGALGEISGDAALFISGRDADELRRAMNLIREASHRKRLVESGLQRAMLYDWDATASKFFGLLKKAQEESQKPAAKVFFDRWKQLRRLQAEVDLL